MKHHQIGLGIAFAVALGVAAPALAQQAVQWRVEDGGNGHWYARNNTPLTWEQAVGAANARGGILASTTSAAELAFVRVALISDGMMCWLGGTIDCSAASGPCCDNCVWRWTSGEPFDVSWTGWVGDNDYTTERLVTNGIGFDDMCSPCAVQDYRPPSIIEWSADCNGDGIVDYGQCRDGSLPDYDGNNIPDCCESGTPCTVGNYPVQWRVEDGGNGHWYRRLSFGSPDRSFSNARDVAAAAGGMLATPLSEAENNFVRDLNRFQYRSYWLGGVQIDPACSGIGCAWRWITDEVWEYTNWCCSGIDNDVGNEDCLASSEDGSWNSVPCVGGLGLEHFMVEWSADCNADGIVDYGQILQGQLVDADSNGVPDICEVDPCPGDINESGVVNGIDLAAILAYWGTDGGKFPRADANGDGIVDASDLAIVLSGWGDCP